MTFQKFWAVDIQPVAPENTRFVIKLKLHETINETADRLSKCDERSLITAYSNEL